MDFIDQVLAILRHDYNISADQLSQSDMEFLAASSASPLPLKPDLSGTLASLEMDLERWIWRNRVGIAAFVLDKAAYAVLTMVMRRRYGLARATAINSTCYGLAWVCQGGVSLAVGGKQGDSFNFAPYPFGDTTIGWGPLMGPAVAACLNLAEHTLASMEASDLAAVAARAAALASDEGAVRRWLIEVPREPEIRPVPRGPRGRFIKLPPGWTSIGGGRMRGPGIEIVEAFPISTGQPMPHTGDVVRQITYHPPSLPSATNLFGDFRAISVRLVTGDIAILKNPTPAMLSVINGSRAFFHGNDLYVFRFRPAPGATFVPSADFVSRSLGLGGVELGREFTIINGIPEVASAAGAGARAGTIIDITRETVTPTRWRRYLARFSRWYGIFFERLRSAGGAFERLFGLRFGTLAARLGARALRAGRPVGLFTLRTALRGVPRAMGAARWALGGTVRWSGRLAARSVGFGLRTVGSVPVAIAAAPLEIAWGMGEISEALYRRTLWETHMWGLIREMRQDVQSGLYQRNEPEFQRLSVGTAAFADILGRRSRPGQTIINVEGGAIYHLLGSSAPSTTETELYRVWRSMAGAYRRQAAERRNAFAQQGLDVWQNIITAVGVAISQEVGVVTQYLSLFGDIASAPTAPWNRSGVERYRNSLAFQNAMRRIQAAAAASRAMAASVSGQATGGGPPSLGGATGHAGRNFWLFRGRDRRLLLQTLRDLEAIVERDQLLASGRTSLKISVRAPILPLGVPGLPLAVSTVINALRYDKSLVRDSNRASGVYSLLSSKN